MLLLNPFDPKSVLLAKHAQHVVLIHFPVALFISGVLFGWLGQWKARPGLLDAGYYNLLLAAIFTIPTTASGLLAWQLQLEGQPLKGVLLLHLLFACVSVGLIWLVWWLRRSVRQAGVHPSAILLAMEAAALGVIALTAHLGGFLSGVNAPS
jgi:uncharacterized membrane protein